MRKLITLTLISMFVFTMPALAQKGASETALEKASPNAIFNRVTDWFATVGKDDVEKEKILAERKAERAAKKAEKKAAKAKKEAGKMKEEMKEESGKMKKNMDKEMKGKMKK